MAALAPAVVGGPAVAPALAAGTTCGASYLLGVRVTDGAVSRWRLTDPDSGQPGAATTVLPASSDAPRLLAADRGSADLWAVQEDGRLLLRRWTGSGYAAPTRAATGWTSVRELVASGAGVLYVLDTAGVLRWWRWTGSTWAPGSGRAVASGWGTVREIASGGDGVLYTVRTDGSLWWWSFGDPTTGLAAARPPVAVGAGWQSLREVTGAGDGLLYAVTSGGTLRAYNHLGAQSGRNTWSVPRTLTGSWGTWRALTLSPDSCSSPADRAEAFARAQVGDPYVYGATGPNAWDCSGLTLKSWAAGGVTLARRSSEQYTSRTAVRLPYSQRRPGDLVFWSSNGTGSGIYHVATYVGQNQVVSAPRAGQTVRVQTVWTSQLLPTVVRPAG